MCLLAAFSHLASKAAFMPPPASYGLKWNDIIFSGNHKPNKREHVELMDRYENRYQMILNDYAPWSFTDEEEQCFEAFYVRSKRGKNVACLFVRCIPNARYTILFSHPNAVDLGVMSGYMLGLAQEINCNIMGYDYSGYGCSTGRPNESNLYADAEAVFEALQMRYHIRSENIILYGQSIGSVPTVDLATRNHVAGVILHSAFTSGVRVMWPKKQCTLVDAFDNISKVPKIKSPVLVIHGTADDVVEFVHGEKIYEMCKYPLNPLWVQGAGHNDIERFRPFIQRLKLLVAEELEAYHRQHRISR